MAEMKRVILRTAVLMGLLFGTGATARATEVGAGRNFGLGFAVGTPTSIVGKAFLGGENAIDFGLGFWRYGRDCWHDNRGVRHCYGDGFNRLSINGDYLWQDNLAQGSARLDWHIGAGARMWLFDDYYDDNVALAARMPVGLDLTFPRPSFLEVFLELAPALYIVPGVDLDIEAFVGVRFYF
jgi:hypothetical protein